jgi:hypothetical protein
MVTIMTVLPPIGAALSARLDQNVRNPTYGCARCDQNVRNVVSRGGLGGALERRLGVQAAQEDL